MKEMWDLYDRNRNMLDRKVERGTKLNDDEYHLVSNAWIRNSKGKFLISQRVEWKSHPLMWECTGGSVIMGEDTYQGAIREVKEELGIDVRNVPYAFVGTTTRYYKDCPDILDVYIFEIDISIEKVTFQKEEVNDVKWATKDEILELYNSGKFEATGFFMDALNFERELYYSNV